MRLSSVEMQGFKSFPDKTRLEFIDGITAVVGPNGSGKSNIADAVRWVLGEQSTKTLRGGKMEDIIFNGTQSRKAVGYASVDLTIDNKGKSLEHYDEKITIGRRLYRSGESEYRVNGDIVRLRDVHELFMDTGLGRDGYSIIGQGRISEIVSAKSTERRLIFEEAAGIAKYRYRRTEAQRKLDAAQENLVRLYDILAELEDRVGPLKVQSEKAKKYLVLAEERKELEISIWVNSFDSLKNQIEEQKNNSFISKNDYDNLNIASEELERNINDTYHQMQQLAVASDERRSSIKKLEEELSKNDSQVAVLNNDIRHNIISVDKLKQELSGAGQNREETAKIINHKKAALSEIKQLLDSIKKSISESEISRNSMASELSSNADKIDELSARRDSLQNAVSEIRLEQASKESILQQSSQRLNELKSSGNQHDNVVKEHEDNLEHCNSGILKQKDNIQSVENSNRGYILKRQSRQKKLDDIILKKSSTIKKAEDAASRIKILQDMESTMEGYFGSVKYILSQSKKGALGGIHGAVSSLIATNSEHITAVETALGAAIQNIVVDDEKSAKQCIAMLKKANIGRATFLPITSIKGKKSDFSELEKHHGFVGNAADLVSCSEKYQSIINQLLGRVCVVDDLDTGSTIAKESGYRFRVVTLDGQVVNAGGSYTGGSTSKSSGVLGRQNEIEKLSSGYKSFLQEAETFEPEIKAVNEELAFLDATLKGAEAEVKNAQEELVKLGFSKEQIERMLNQALQNRDLAKLEITKLVERLGELKEGELSAKQLLEETSQQITSLSSEISSLSEKNIETAELNENSRKELSDSKMKELSVNNDISNLEDELSRLEKQEESTSEARERLIIDSNNIENDNIRIKNDIEELEVRNKQLFEEIESHNFSIKEFIESRTGLEKTATEMRKKEKELSSQRERVSTELTRLEERGSLIQKEYDNIISRLWDEYELTRSNAEKIAKPVENQEKSNQRLTEIRNKIRVLGSVNVDAVEEYLEVSERYEFLLAQLKDVEQAKTKLNSLIYELTDEMQHMFKENFEKISSEFSTTFVDLFGGGRGELALTDPENVLDSGIEIRVQPPGKVIKNLSLLSGGEQAFVAIAIYFAILKVKPAPFVLLDEIEAALDDVNVVKFANYLRTLCDKIQFIAITHRRGTMEEADVLYGVTMQEEGVSKLLELKIQEVEVKLGMGAE